MLDGKVKIGYYFVIVLCVRVATALAVGPLNLTRTGFLVRATAVDEECRRCLCL